MDENTTAALIGAEWEVQTGFIWKLREGEYDAEGFDRLLTTLKATKIYDKVTIERELVTVTWLIPLTLEWIKMSWIDMGKDIELIDHAIMLIVTELYRILGVP